MRNISTWVPSAPSPTPWPTDAWNGPATLLAFVGAIVLMFGLPLIYLYYAVATGQIDPHHPQIKPDAALVVQVVTYIPVVVYLLFVLPRLAHSPLRDLGFRAPDAHALRIAAFGVPAMLLAVTTTGALGQTLVHSKDTEASIALLRDLKTPGELILFIILATVLAPMVEELLFRAFLFNAVSRFASIPLSAAISSLAFGALHAPWPPSAIVAIALPLACGGFVLAYVYATARNYWANVIVHGCFNAINVAGILFLHTG